MPDMGSITLIGAEKVIYTGTGPILFRKEFRGLKEDFNKLPKDDDQATGSFIIFLDTGDYAEYLAYNKTWYLI